MEPSIIYNYWFNTGCISNCHTSNSEMTTSIDPEQELQELERILYRLLPLQLHPEVQKCLESIPRNQ